MSTINLKGDLANSFINHLPPLIQSTLLEDKTFREEYNLETDPILTLSNSDISFQRSDLFEAVKKVLSGSSIEKITDINGAIWNVICTNIEQGLPKPRITYENQDIFLPDLVLLSTDQSIRIKYLETVTSNVYLPEETVEFWQKTLSDRPLTYDEIDLFQIDRKETPIEIMRLLGYEIESDHINFSTLVPSSPKYFNRLIGVNSSHSLGDFAGKNLKTHLNKLTKWDKCNGFLYSLILSSHSFITDEIMIDELSDKELTDAFDYIIKSGDRISQLGAIEVGLRVIPSRPHIEQYLLDLIEQIRDDNIEEANSGFALLSSLFVFIYGELSRLRFAPTEPPFYRRLAALSQTALIQREIIHSNMDIEKFREYIFNIRAEQFLIQSYSDMRVEPRWNPDFASAQQIKADFFGRIILAGIKYEKNIKNTELSNLILGTQQDSLQSLFPNLNLFLPGPLEGKLEMPDNLPENMTEMVKKQLDNKSAEPSSFIGLVNTALIFGVNTELIGLAADLIKSGKYRFSNVEKKEQLLSILNGLSTVAAISKNKDFADDLLILVRKYRYDPQFAISPVEAMRICLIASASRVEINEWIEYVGNWMTELSFSDFKDNEGAILLSHLQCLLQAVPELWGTCGRADAALNAYNNRLKWNPSC